MCSLTPQGGRADGLPPVCSDQLVTKGYISLQLRILKSAQWGSEEMSGPFFTSSSAAQSTLPGPCGHLTPEGTPCDWARWLASTEAWEAFMLIDLHETPLYKRDVEITRLAKDKNNYILSIIRGKLTKQEMRNPSPAKSRRKRLRKRTHLEMYKFYPGCQRSHALTKTHLLKMIG